MPRCEVVFKVAMEILHEGGHYHKVKFSWPNYETAEFDTIDTGFLKDWTLIKKEGGKLMALI